MPRTLGWPAACAALALAAALAFWVAPRELLDWQPQRAASEPWRWWSAAFVHWTPAHLLANLAGCAALALFGASAGLGTRALGAWAAAWPLTHLALGLQPELRHYGGLSGLLHAGVAVAATFLVWQAQGLRRAVGWAVLAGLALKVLLEAPWAGALQPAPGDGLPVAPLAHAAGAVAGTLCAGLTLIRRPFA